MQGTRAHDSAELAPLYYPTSMYTCHLYTYSYWVTYWLLGKTYNALKALRASQSGVYCGPLRLLACEVSERLSAAGLPCRLVTGQEVRPLG